MVILNFIRAALFEWCKRRAVAKADRDARIYRKKFLVLVWKRRPVVVSMQGLKSMIATHRFSREFTPEKARQLAIYIAYPPNK